MWTIGTQEDEDEENDRDVGGAIAATRAAETRAQRASFSAGSADSATAAATTTTPLSPFQVEAMASSPMEILTPSIETFDEAESSAKAVSSTDDVVMSESEAETEADIETSSTYELGQTGLYDKKATGLGGRTGSMDIDTMTTPTIAKRPGRHNISTVLDLARRSRSVTQESDGLFNSETGSRRDTPIPAELVPTSQ